jgi:hypothetical protein
MSRFDARGHAVVPIKSAKSVPRDLSVLPSGKSSLDRKVGGVGRAWQIRFAIDNCHGEISPPYLGFLMCAVTVYKTSSGQAKVNGRDDELFLRITLLRRFAKIAVLARTSSLASLGAVLRRSA